MSLPISPHDITAILTHLDLPLPSPTSLKTPTLPLPPLQFLDTYLPSLPPSLLGTFASLVPPKDRTRIPAIKRRRMLFASQEPLPRLLRAHEGRLRWPLMWERLGGDPWAEGPAAGEEEEWARSGGFMMPVIGSGGAGADGEGEGGDGGQGGGGVVSHDGQKVRKLGGFLRVLEEEREAEGVRAAKRRERARDAEGEEFEDSDSEEEEENDRGEGAAATRAAAERPVVSEDQEGVERVFEKKLLELFLDGLDTLDYTPIDFTEPPNGDPIAIRDAEDRYFDDEEPSRTPGGSTQGEGRRESVVQGGGDRGMQNGVGEYDY